jgi:hypothetical protein
MGKDQSQLSLHFTVVIIRQHALSMITRLVECDIHALLHENKLEIHLSKHPTQPLSPSKIGNVAQGFASGFYNNGAVQGGQISGEVR